MSNYVNYTEQQSPNKDAKGVSRVVQESRFFTLPTELRTMVYDYHFAIPRPFMPRPLTRGSAFFRNHEWNCPLNEHRFRWDTSLAPGVRRAHAICQSPFGRTEDIPIPSSVLDLLLVCHDITEEAKGRSYKVNHFVFGGTGGLTFLKLFIKSIGERYLSLTKLSFSFNSMFANEVFGLLSKSTNLKALHIFINPEASGIRFKRVRRYLQSRALEGMVGMDALLKIRGLKTVEVSVQSQHWRSVQPKIETLLRSKLLLPHPDAPASQPGVQGEAS